ncbi:MAG: hypothetical protein GY795_11410 [Desulfobacterales bacterium]|nr:hypothetical protein [Desulfobacterales bacterium]
MGLTIAVPDIGPRSDQRFGQMLEKIRDVTFDDSYPTGGEALTPVSLGLGEIDVFVAEGAGGYVFEYDRTNDKLKAFTGGSEVANLTDLASLTVRVSARGIEGS